MISRMRTPVPTEQTLSPKRYNPVAASGGTSDTGPQRPCEDRLETTGNRTIASLPHEMMRDEHQLSAGEAMPAAASGKASAQAQEPITEEALDSLKRDVSLRWQKAGFEDKAAEEVRCRLVTTLIQEIRLIREIGSKGSKKIGSQNIGRLFERAKSVNEMTLADVKKNQTHLEKKRKKHRAIVDTLEAVTFSQPSAYSRQEPYERASTRLESEREFHEALVDALLRFDAAKLSPSSTSVHRTGDSPPECLADALRNLSNMPFLDLNS